MLDKVIRVRNSSFETRSSKRDDEHIERLLRQIASALNHAAHETEAQRDGLRRRLDAVITQAAVIGGNDIDDSLARDKADAAALAASDVEIARAESRLKTLEEQLSHFTFLEAALQSRFPMAKG